MELKKFETEGLSRIFTQAYLGQINENQTLIISVLSYFATSLFDKFTAEGVLWDAMEAGKVGTTKPDVKGFERLDLLG